MDSEHHSETTTDWAALVARVQERLYLSQLEIAARCGVARQTMSAWMHGRRVPGLFAKRTLLSLAAEAGVLDTKELPGEPPEAGAGGGAEFRQLRALLGQISPESRREVLEFARFKLMRERL